MAITKENQAKKLAKEELAQRNGITVTSVMVYILKEQTGGKLRAKARIVLNEQLQLTELRIVEGANGLFVGYPNDPNYKGDDYRSLFYPITEELRDHIEYVVLAQYNEILKKDQAQK